MLEAIKRRKTLAVGLGLLLLGGVAWGIAELAGEANKNCADAGFAQVSLSLDSVSLNNKESVAKNAIKAKVPTANIDWTQWNSYSKKLDAATADYKTLAQKAKDEAAKGPVSDATKSAGLAAAQKVNEIANQFADFQEKGNCMKYAKQNRALGASIVANADMMFNEVAKDKISASSDAQQALTDARKDLFADVKDTLSDDDKNFAKTNVLPKLQSISDEVTNIISSVTGLLDKIKEQAMSGGIGGLTSCASSAASSDNPAGALLEPVTGLLSMVQSLGTDVADTVSEFSGL